MNFIFLIIIYFIILIVDVKNFKFLIVIIIKFKTITIFILTVKRINLIIDSVFIFMNIILIGIVIVVFTKKKSYLFNKKIYCFLFYL